MNFLGQKEDKMAKVGVVLSGCGVYDGSEIHESVMTLFYLEKKEADIVCMAPDKDQMHVINHLDGEVSAGEKRNVLVESARIARGDIKDITKVDAEELEALILPGGFGAAKNLSDFATAGKDCTVNPAVKSLVKNMYQREQPIGALCIAPAVVSKIFEDTAAEPELTIGSDMDTADALEEMGSRHTEAAVEETVVDRENKIVTTPCYMLADGVLDVSKGVKKLVDEVYSLM